MERENATHSELSLPLPLPPFERRAGTVGSGEDPDPQVAMAMIMIYYLRVYYLVLHSAKHSRRNAIVIHMMIKRIASYKSSPPADLIPRKTRPTYLHLQTTGNPLPLDF